MKRIWLYFGICSLLACSLPARAGMAPDVLARSTTEEVVHIVTQDAAIKNGNTKKVDALVETEILPHFDFEQMTRLAVARIPGDGTRRRTKVFSELQSHYLFADRFGRPGKGNDKGKVEGLVGYARRNFLVPVPHVTSFTELNAHLRECGRRRLNDRLRGHDETVGGRLGRDRAFLPLPPAPYEACEKRAARVSSPARVMRVPRSSCSGSEPSRPAASKPSWPTVQVTSTT